MNLTSESLVGAGPELEDLPEHLPRDDDRGRPAARSAVEEGSEDAVAARRRRAAFLAELGEDEHLPARFPRVDGPGARRLDVGQQRVDPLVAGLAMVIPLADQRERALKRGAAAQEEDRGVVMRVEDGPSERRVLAAGKLLRGALLRRGRVRVVA